MVLRGAISLLGAFEGVGPENLDFFGPKWHSQNYVPRHKNNRYINSYNVTSLWQCRTDKIIIHTRANVYSSVGTLDLWHANFLCVFLMFLPALSLNKSKPMSKILLFEVTNAFRSPLQVRGPESAKSITNSKIWLWKKKNLRKRPFTLGREKGRGCKRIEGE